MLLWKFDEGFKSMLKIYQTEHLTFAELNDCTKKKCGSYFADFNKKLVDEIHNSDTLL